MIRVQAGAADEPETGMIEIIVGPFVHHHALRSIAPYQMLTSIGNSAVTPTPACASQCPK